MIWTRIQKVLLALICGGMLLQSTSCVQSYLVPTAANIAGAVALEAVFQALGFSGTNTTT